VTQSVSLRNGFHFNEARALLEQARLRLGTGGPDDLRRLVEQAQDDLRLVVRLDEARSRGATLVAMGNLNPSSAEPFYAAAFADAGLGPDRHDSKSVAAGVQVSTLRAELIAALDDWASLTPDRGRRALLLEVARQSDPNLARNRFRRPELWLDGDGLAELIRGPTPAELSPQLATALARIARENHADAVPMLTAVHARFPQDFWLNYELGFALYQANRWDEALGYLRAALSARRCGTWAGWMRP
jgi:tetratricopeptide (TPR) repeat protein